MLTKPERDKLAALYESAVKAAQRFERQQFSTQAAVTAGEKAVAAGKAFYEYLDALSEPLT